MQVKPKFVAGLVTGALLFISLTAMAAPTPEQQQKLQAAQTEMAEARKNMVKAQVDAGFISEERGQRIIDQIDASLERHKPLTDEQKQALKDAFDQQIAARKALINAQLEAGIISKAQSERMLKQLEAIAEYRQKVGFGNRWNTLNPNKRLPAIGRMLYKQFGPRSQKGVIQRDEIHKRLMQDAPLLKQFLKGAPLPKQFMQGAPRQFFRMGPGNLKEGWRRQQQDGKRNQDNTDKENAPSQGPLLRRFPLLRQRLMHLM